MQESPRIWRLYNRLLNIAIDEFRDIVESGKIFCSNITKEPLKLRLYLCDESFIDIYYSIKGKYSYHWNRMLTHNEIYRHDNTPKTNEIVAYSHPIMTSTDMITHHTLNGRSYQLFQSIFIMGQKIMLYPVAFQMTQKLP